MPYIVHAAPPFYRATSTICNCDFHLRFPSTISIYDFHLRFLSTISSIYDFIYLRFHLSTISIYDFIYLRFLSTISIYDFIYDFHLRFPFTISIYDFHLPFPSTTCIYDLHLRFASTMSVYDIHLRLRGSSTICIYDLHLGCTPTMYIYDVVTIHGRSIPRPAGSNGLEADGHAVHRLLHPGLRRLHVGLVVKLFSSLLQNIRYSSTLKEARNERLKSAPVLPHRL